MTEADDRIVAAYDPLYFGRRTALRLAQLVNPDGSFRYRYNAASQVDMKGYNALRHAGCIWALNDALGRFSSHREIRDAVDRALDWFLKTYYRRITEELSCIIEEDKIKLGGNALAVLAILSTIENGILSAERSLRDLVDLVDPLCQYMMTQVTADGDFVHKRDVATGEIEPFHSDYYTGEALFALLKSVQRKPNDRMRYTLLDLLHRLTHRGYGIPEQSHWMMYAAEVGYLLDPDITLLGYVEKVVENILDIPIYRDRQYSTPIACRSEALLCYLRICARSGSADSPLFRSALKELSVNIGLQLKCYQPDGAFQRGIYSPIVRIDYLQHNLSSLLGFEQFYESGMDD